MAQQRLFTAPQNAEFIIIDQSEARSQQVKRFFNAIPCGKGHVSERYVASGKCVRCRQESHIRNYEKNKEHTLARQAKWKQENKKRISEQGKEYRSQNDEVIKLNKHQAWHRDKEEIKIRRKPYFDKNREKHNKNKREYLAKNREQINAMRSKQHKKRMKFDKQYIEARKARSFLRSSIERIKSENTKRVSEQIGYSPKDLIENMKSKFAEGMTWDNHGEWHIDHIKPIKAFIDEGITDPAIINALDNLQPLWAKDNLSKGAKYERQT